MIAKFQWQDARTVQDAITELDGKSMVKAGGIDIMDRLKEGLDAPAKLVNIRTIPGLDQVREDSAGLHIGPMVTLDQLDKNETVRASYTALADAAGHAATPHIRNVATVGGNVLQRPRCWYFRSEQFHCLKKGGDRCFAQDGENDYQHLRQPDLRDRSPIGRRRCPRCVGRQPRGDRQAWSAPDPDRTVLCAPGSGRASGERARCR